MAPHEIIVEAPELRLDPERVLQSVDWSETFGGAGPVEIEIGIGKGRFLIAAAEARPDVHHLGVEWANKYLRFAESRARKRGLKNIRFARVDARKLVRVVQSASVRTYYVFYPDPWPKKRHHKRRFLQPETVHQLARSLEAGGALHVTTDHTGYWSVIEPLLDGHPSFERQPGFGGEDFPGAADGLLTNFETKYAVEGRDRFRGTWRRSAEN